MSNVEKLGFCIKRALIKSDINTKKGAYRITNR